MLESKRIKTEIPGPKSKALMERRRAATPPGVLNALPIFASEGHGEHGAPVE